MWGQKNEVYVITQVDRDTRCIVGWDVVWERDTDALQAMLDRSPQARQSYSDAFSTYGTLVYAPGKHQANKRQTYSVEADNAELRHYLARKSRCFSRCIHALWRAIKLLVYAWNRRQMQQRAFPQYPLYVKDFLYP
jgi:IS1 family transposase